MLFTYPTLVLLLVFITSCLTSPVDRRQPNTTSLASCAPLSILIEQFTTFTGNVDQRPHITFYLTNPNPGAPGKMLCTATLGSNEGNFNDSSFYSCEVHLNLVAMMSEKDTDVWKQHPGTGFNWQSGQLKVFQYQVCTNGRVNTISRQIIIAAEAEIATTSYPGEGGGEYSESVTGSTSIPVVDVQDVEEINGGKGRQSAAKGNVTCGFVGPLDMIYTLGSCNLSDVGPGLRS